MMRARSTVLCVAFLLLLGGAICGSAQAGEFGISNFTAQTTMAKEFSEEVGGEKFPEFADEPYVFSQAGGHPFALTTTIEFNQEPSHIGAGRVSAGGGSKDLLVDLPPGLLADPLAGPRCPLSVFTRQGVTQCPASTQIGVIELDITSIEEAGHNTLILGIYNLVPEAGQSAEFGIPTARSYDFVLTGHLVHTSSGYGFTVVSNNIPQVGISRFKLSFWGVPADASHKAERGRRCESVRTEPPACDNSALTSPGGEEAGVAPVPFLVMPADCTSGSPTLRVFADSWQDPGSYVEGPTAALPQATDCDALSFEPSIEMTPDTMQADSPVGLGVHLKVPQTEEPDDSRRRTCATRS